MRAEIRHVFEEIDSRMAYLRDEMTRLESDLKMAIKDRDEEVATRREIQRACDFNRRQYCVINDILDLVLKDAGSAVHARWIEQIQKVREERG